MAKHTKCLSMFDHFAGLALIEMVNNKVTPDIFLNKKLSSSWFGKLTETIAHF